MIVTLQSDQALRKKDIDYLGGSFGWFEKIKLRGTGSSKFIYLGGLEAFDELKVSVSDVNYVSFELFKDGLALRFSKRNIQKACLIRFDVLDRISVHSQRIRVRDFGKELIVKTAEVEILFDDKKFRLGLPPTYYNSGIDFLNKKPLFPFCEHTMKTEIIDGDEIGWIRIFLELMRWNF